MRDERWLSEEEHNFVFARTPRLGVEAVVLTPEGLIMTKRAIEPFKGLWHFPGGRVFHGEPLLEALKRVGRNELGVKLEPIRLAGFTETLIDHKLPGGGHIHTVALAYLAAIVAGELQGDEQSSEIRAFKDIPQDCHPTHRTFLQEHWAELFS